MLSNIKYLYLVLIILGLLLTSLTAKDPAHIKKLSKEADVILTGKVKAKKSDWNKSKTRIYTRATLDVDEYLKGENDGNSVEVTYAGGEVGDVGEIYTHMPRFEEHEEVLVFLKKDKKNRGYHVLDGEEGKIKVLRQPGTKEKVTKSDLQIKHLKAQIKKYLTE